MEYVPRILDGELDELFPHVPAIAIDGAKAVGKTTTAAQRAASVVSLDSVVGRESFQAEPRLILQRPRPVLIDEWQKVPEIWDVVRRAVDDNPIGGQFLLAGSATPRPGSTVHSGAGRIGRLRMRPMTLSERGLGSPSVSLRALLAGGRPPLSGHTTLTLLDYVEEITGSGFPALRAATGRARRFQLDSYLANVVDRDIPEQGLELRRREQMLLWLGAYAAATATTASYTTILDAATPGQADKPSRVTVAAYRDMLLQLWLLDPVPAWTPSGSALTRLQQTPKHHLADPALAARLLGLHSDALVGGEGQPIGPQSGSLLGHLFESLVTLCVRVPAQAAEASVGHLRTGNGDHEIDLVVVRGDGRVLAVEVKLGGSVDDDATRHLRWLRDKIGPRLLDAIVITTGADAYRRKDGIGVVPLGTLAP